MKEATFKREMIGNEGMVLLDTVRRLNRRGAVAHLLKLLLKTHPADMAWVFRHLSPAERKKVFNVIAQTEMVGEFLSEVDQAILLEIVQDLTPKFMVAVISEMASDDVADLLEALPEEMANEIRQLMVKEDREEVDELMQYHPETAGGLMSPDFMALDGELSAGDAIKIVQERSEESEMSFYLYITHGEGQLAGVISLRELLLHPPYRQLKNIMNSNVTSVNTDTNQDEVAHVISQYNILAVPVVDSNYKLVGIVTVDDIIDVIREEATEDFLRMAGAGKDSEILLKSTVANAITRAPWLFASWVGGVMAMLIITLFQSEYSHPVQHHHHPRYCHRQGQHERIRQGCFQGDACRSHPWRGLWPVPGAPCILWFWAIQKSRSGGGDGSIFCYDPGGDCRFFCASYFKTFEF